MTRLTGKEIERQMSYNLFGIPLSKKATSSLRYVLGTFNISIDLRPNIVITPFDPNCLGPNSYDVHLYPVLKVRKNAIPRGMLPAIPYDKDELDKINYENGDRMWFENAQAWEDARLNPHKYDIANLKYLQNPLVPAEYTEIIIPETGLILNPRFAYLGCTAEYTETRNLFPSIDGKSTIGRNFLCIHQTAGDGDDGFCGQWTLEIKNNLDGPVVVFPYMRIGQLYWDETSGIKTSYADGTHHYNGQNGPTEPAPIKIEPNIFKSR